MLPSGRRRPELDQVRRLMSWRPAVQTILSVVLTLVAGLMFGRYFDGRTWWWPVAAAAVAGGTASLVPGLRRGDPILPTLAWAAGALLAAALIVMPPMLRAGDGWVAALRAVFPSVIHSWPRMLSSGAPAQPAPDLMVLPVVLSWLASAGAALCALRSRVLVLPLLPSFVLFAVGLVLAPPGPAALRLTAAFLAPALVLLFLRASAEGGTWPEISTGAAETTEVADLRRWEGGRPATRFRFGRLAIGLPLVAATGALGLLGAAAVPAPQHRFDPRTIWQAPIENLDVPSPLLTLKSRLETGPPAELFTVTVAMNPRPRAPLRLTTAVLDRFDGHAWTAESRFVRPPARLARPEGAGGHGTYVNLAVRLDAGAERLEAPFLPVAGVPSRFDVQNVALDPHRGVLALREAAAAGYRYAVTGWLPVADTGIRRAAAIPDPAEPVTLDLPGGLPPDLTELAAHITRNQTNAYDQLTSLETYLRTVPYTLDAPPGSSLAAISRMLLGNRKQDRAGFAEQHAAAFALMARSLNLPARVSVGYEISAERAATGRVVVTTKDAHAWPEVHFAGYGWMPFEPTDITKVTGSGSRPPSGTALPAGQLERDPTLGSPGQYGLAAGAPARRLWPWLLGAALAVVPAAIIVTLMVKGRRRRRRRHAGTATGRLLGAWSEALDRLAEAGWRPGPHLSPPRVAARVKELYGERAGQPMDDLARLVEEAVFGSGAPAPDQVRQAWVCEGQLSTALDARHHRPRRWLRRVDPRSLRRDRRTRLRPVTEAFARPGLTRFVTWRRRRAPVAEPEQAPIRI